MRRWSLAFLLVLGLAGVATATPPPRTAPYVDPQAPGFRWPAVDYDADGVFDRVDHCPDTRPGCKVDQWGCSHDSDGDGVCDGRDQCPDTPKGMAVDENGCQAGVSALKSTQGSPNMPKEVTPPPPPVPVAAPVTDSERQLIQHGRLRLENVYFEKGSAVLLPESETSINEAGSALEKFKDIRVEVEGHTDTRGPAAYNLRLSQMRAETVRSYLLKHFQLREDQHRQGLRREAARDEGAQRGEFLRNRRVELQVLNPEVLPAT